MYFFSLQGMFFPPMGPAPKFKKYRLNASEKIHNRVSGILMKGNGDCFPTRTWTNKIIIAFYCPVKYPPCHILSELLFYQPAYFHKAIGSCINRKGIFHFIKFKVPFFG